MQDLDGLKPERLDAVEDPLAGAEQDRRDVQRELVDDSGDAGLAHSRGATRDVYAGLAGRLTRLCVSGVEAAGDEVEGRPAFHLDRLVSVMGEHKHRRVVRRLGTPPAAPVLIPLAADRPEHVPPHDIRAARAHEPVGRRRVGVVGALVAEMPPMELAPTLTEWILAALVGPSDETVERDRHVAGGVRHRRPLGLVCDLRVATAPLEPPPSHRIVKPPGPATAGFRIREERPARALLPPRIGQLTSSDSPMMMPSGPRTKQSR